MAAHRRHFIRPYRQRRTGDRCVVLRTSFAKLGPRTASFVRVQSPNLSQKHRLHRLQRGNEPMVLQLTFSQGSLLKQTSTSLQMSKSDTNHTDVLFRVMISFHGLLELGHEGRRAFLWALRRRRQDSVHICQLSFMNRIFCRLALICTFDL